MAYYWDTGGLLMENRIIKKKLLFLHHLETLPKSSLASEVYLIQKTLSLPGLAVECSKYLAELDITDSVESYTKMQWKHLIKNRIIEKNRQDLLCAIKKYKKISHEELSKENFECKPYLKNLNLHDARTKFKIRSKMCPTVKINFQSDKQFGRDQWSCFSCSKIDSQDHLKMCPEYEYLRRNKDLSKDEDLVRFFQEVIEKRRNQILQSQETMAAARVHRPLHYAVM